VETTNAVVTMAQLFVQQAQAQEPGKQPLGRDDIVVTDTQCRPN
jgi:hypothetical protein